METINDTQTDAARYGAGVEAGLLETVVLGEYLDDPSAGDYETPGDWYRENYTDPTDKEVASFESAVRNATAEDSSELWNEWFNDVLEVKVLGEYSARSWDITGAEILITYGGPSCRLIWNGNHNGWLDLVTTWGSDTDRRTVNLAQLVDLLNDYAEEVTA